MGAETKIANGGPKLPLNEIAERLEQKGFFPHEFEQIYRPPAISIQELRDAIPAHLFKRSLTKSCFYFITNVIVVGLLFYAATLLQLLPAWAEPVGWVIYWWFQGVFGMGLWTLGHECGHHAFSDYRWFDEILGFTIHSLFLLPYHNWRISHATHHAFTGHMAKDQNYVPSTEAEYYPGGRPSPLMEAIRESSIYNVALTALLLVAGWPAHLIWFKSGRSYAPRRASLLLPSSPVFRPEHRRQVICSNVAVVLVILGLGVTAWRTSFGLVWRFYLVPYLLVHAWLITITFLHHTDVYLPHYSPKAWNWARGSCATVDRDYGSFFNVAFHHLNDTHVAHHFFPQMPFYHAVEARPFLKQKLGEHYFSDSTPFWKAIYRGVKNCHFVKETGDVLFYRK